MHGWAGIAPSSIIRHRVAFACAWLFYTSVAVAYTFPLVLHLSTTVPHDAGDPMLSTAILWWNAHVLPFTARWWNGFAFYPAPGMLAMSDTRLGESLIASPLQWLGVTPITAYNLTLLATYPLCALAAHWLAWVVTKRHDAAAIAALAYAFCPFRVAHIQHLELLGAFGMPVALGALHMHLRTDRVRWLVLFAAAVVVQAISASYYALFFAVLLALWVAWFVRLDWRGLTAIAIAGAAAVVAFAPLIAGYARVHADYGFERPFTEIIALSGDVSSLVQGSSLLALWGWMPAAFGSAPERDLFPGVTVVALAAIGGTMAWRRSRRIPDRLDRLAASLLLPAAAALAAIAACGWWLAPWRIALPGVLISSETPYKPFSLALVLAVAAVALSSRARAAWARRSSLAFYLIAAAAMFACSLGPKPAFLGHQFFYEPPYAWLMELPGFGAIRVPARFAMVAMLPLSIAGAMAFSRMRFAERTRLAVAALLMGGVLADGWMRELPLAAVPDLWPPERARGYAAVLELPLGDPFGDLAAMFRATVHGRPIVNGNSGFEPTHYYTLSTAIEEHDQAIFDGLPSSGGNVLVVVDERASGGGLTPFVAADARATPLGHDGRWTFFSLAPPPAPPTACAESSATIRSIRDARGRVDAAPITDDDPRTWWSTDLPQHAGDALVLELDRLVRPCALRLSVGEFRISYPRALAIDLSMDAVNWSTVAATRTAGLTMRAALEDPRRVTLSIPLTPSPARFVRLRLTDSHPSIPWVVADVSVLSASGGGGL